MLDLQLQHCNCHFLESLIKIQVPYARKKKAFVEEQVDKEIAVCFDRFSFHMKSRLAKSISMGEKGRVF